ncbi:MAG: hypothetical protein IPK19_19240 [Chloroflexi bacterium]|nr:hypothetical protein [Chloroflexota bacterium]
MMSNRKPLALVLVVLLIGAIAVGASGVLAQDTAPGFGWRHEGMMGSGPTMWSAVAEALDMDAEALWTALRSGQTLEAIAEAQGIELDAVYEAATATMTEHVNAMVEAGVITQEQADEHLAWMHDNLGQMPMMAMGESCGMGMGMRMAQRRLPDDGRRRRNDAGHASGHDERDGPHGRHDGRLEHESSSRPPRPVIDGSGNARHAFVTHRGAGSASAPVRFLLSRRQPCVDPAHRQPEYPRLY